MRISCNFLFIFTPIFSSKMCMSYKIAIFTTAKGPKFQKSRQKTLYTLISRRFYSSFVPFCLFTFTVSILPSVFCAPSQSCRFWRWLVRAKAVSVSLKGKNGENRNGKQPTRFSKNGGWQHGGSNTAHVNYVGTVMNGGALRILCKENFRIDERARMDWQRCSFITKGRKNCVYE